MPELLPVRLLSIRLYVSKFCTIPPYTGQGRIRSVIGSSGGYTKVLLNMKLRNNKGVI